MTLGTQPSGIPKRRGLDTWSAKRHPSLLQDTCLHCVQATLQDRCSHCTQQHRSPPSSPEPRRHEGISPHAGIRALGQKGPSLPPRTPGREAAGRCIELCSQVPGSAAGMRPLPSGFQSFGGLPARAERARGEPPSAVGLAWRWGRSAVLQMVVKVRVP